MDESLFACSLCPKQRLNNYSAVHHHCRETHQNDKTSIVNQRQRLADTLRAVFSLAFPANNMFTSRTRRIVDKPAASPRLPKGRSVECALCARPVSAEYSVSFRNHISRYHMDEALYACRLCPEMRMPDYWFARNHCRTLHQEDESAFVNHSHSQKETVFAVSALCFPHHFPSFRTRQSSTNSAPRVVRNGFGKVCQECKATISLHETGQLQHAARHHRNMKKFACEKCPFTSNNRTRVADHYQDVHHFRCTNVRQTLTVHRATLKADSARLFPPSAPTLPIPTRSRKAQPKTEGKLGTIHCHLCRTDIPHNPQTHTRHILKAHWPEKAMRFVCELCGFGASFKGPVHRHALAAHPTKIAGIEDRRRLHSRRLITLRREAFPGLDRNGRQLKKLMTPRNLLNSSFSRLRRNPKRSAALDHSYGVFKRRRLY